MRLGQPPRPTVRTEGVSLDEADAGFDGVEGGGVVGQEVRGGGHADGAFVVGEENHAKDSGGMAGAHSPIRVRRTASNVFGREQDSLEVAHDLRPSSAPSGALYLRACSRATRQFESIGSLIRFSLSFATFPGIS